MTSTNTDKVEIVDDRAHYDNIHRRKVQKGEPPSMMGMMLGYMKQFQQGVDPTTMSVHPYFLLGISSLELMSLGFTPNEDILTVSTTKCPEERILKVALSALQVLKHNTRKGIDAKGGKPYNPILGEQFHAVWDHLSSPVYASCEQVSHHPPISSIFVEAPACHYEAEASQTYKAQFSITSGMMFSPNGKAVMRFTNLGEEYEVRFPGLAFTGIVVGTPHVYPSGEWKIVCKKTGLELHLTCNVDKVNGYMLKDGDKLYKIKGTVTELHMKHNKTKEKKQLHKVAAFAPLPLYKVKSVPDQQKHESRRVWHECTMHMINNNYDAAAEAKHKVEEEQRKLAKERKEKNETWTPSLFTKTSEVVDGVPFYKYTGPKASNVSAENLDLD